MNNKVLGLFIIFVCKTVINIVTIRKYIIKYLLLLKNEKTYEVQIDVFEKHTIECF